MTKTPRIPDAALSRVPGRALYRMAQSGAEIEIGGDHPSLVLPDVTAKKWGGECWLRVRHADADEMREGDRALERQGARGLEIELPISTKGRKHQIKEGSLKWDVVYDSPVALPVDGIERFQMDFPEGLTWYYQTELTPEEIAEGAERPENVVGSYAGYFDKSGRTLDKDGNEISNYETGKFAHLYRPEMVDAAGNRAWASQQIVGNELLVTLPQEWMATAVYPVTLDPTFGFTGIGASNSGQSAGRTQVNGGFTPGVAGTITQIEAYTRRGGTESDYSLGVYKGASNPDALVGKTVTRQPLDTEAHWEVFSGLSLAFTASDTLYVGSYSSTTANVYYYDSSGATWYFITAEWPDPMTGESSVTRLQSVFATYTEGGGGVTETPGNASISITGLDPIIDITEIPNIDALTITGQDVTEITGFSEVPENASVIVTGLDVNTLISITESPGEVAMTLAGQDVNTAILITEQVLNASLTLVGNDIILTESVIVGGATITINGRQVTVTGDEIISIIRQSGLSIGIRIGI